MILFCFAGQIEDIWSPQMRVKKNHHQKGSLQGKIRQNGQNLLCYNLLCYQGLFLNKRNIHAHNCAQNAKMLQDLFSLNREMQQAARDITPPLPSLQSTCTSSMMESTSSKTSGKQFYIYLDFLLR